jgi:hypothetical protein
MLGCTKDSEVQTYYAGHRNETKVCPRRHLLRNPDVAIAFDLHGQDLRMGDVSGLVWDAVAVVRSALRYRTDEQHKQDMAAIKRGGGR